MVDNVDGGEVRVGGDNRMKHSIDSGEGSSVGVYIVLYVYLVSPYRPSHSPFPQSVYLVPFLLDYPLEIRGVFAGRITGSRHLRVTGSFIKSCLLIRKRPLLAV